MWSDTLFNMNRDYCEQRLNLNCINMNISSLHSAAEFKFLECSHLKLKAHTWNWMWQLLKLTNFTNNYSPIHIQILFIPTEIWVPEHLEGTFVPWVTGRQLHPRRLPTVVWHSSLSQLQAMWQCAFLIPSANVQVFFSVGERDANCIL